MVDEARLAGVPEDVRQAAREAADQGAVTAGQTGCLLTLQIPRYLPVMQFAHDRALRETLFRA